MYKYIKPLIRADNLTYEEFRERWKQAETAIETVPGLKAYRTIHPTAPEQSEFDGIAELHFETSELVEAAVGSNSETPRGEGEIWDAGWIQPSAAFIGEEIVEKDSVEGDTHGLYKHVAFLDRKEGMSPAEFYEYWADEHAPIAREVPGVVRYVRVIPPAAHSPPFDGVAELYFERLEQLQNVLGDGFSRDYDPTDPKARALREDAENLHSIEGRPRFVGTEHSVFSHW